MRKYITRNLLFCTEKDPLLKWGSLNLFADRDTSLKKLRTYPDRVSVTRLASFELPDTKPKEAYLMIGGRGLNGREPKMASRSRKVPIGIGS